MSSAVARTFPSGLNKTLLTVTNSLGTISLVDGFERSTKSSFPVATSQRRVVPSSEALARTFPSGLNDS